MGTRRARVAAALILIWATAVMMGCQRQEAPEPDAVGPDSAAG